MVKTEMMSTICVEAKENTKWLSNGFISEFVAMQLWVICLLSFQAEYSTYEIVSELSTVSMIFLGDQEPFKHCSEEFDLSISCSREMGGGLLAWSHRLQSLGKGTIYYYLLLVLSFILIHLYSAQFHTILSICAEKLCKCISFLYGWV